MFNGTVPAFAPDGGLALAMLRALSVAALISGFGTLAFWTFVLPRVPAAAAVHTRLLWLARLSLAGGILLLGAWTLMQSSQMADAAGLGQALAAVPVVLQDTRFGHVILLQAAASVLTLAALGSAGRAIRRRLAAGLALAALLLQSGHGHALAMPEAPPLLLAATLLHLAGAGFWLGGVPALALVVAAVPPAAGAAACRWFSPLGKICVALVAGSALVQGWVMVASLPGLVGTAYGWMILGKLLLFAVLFGFALLNRYRLGPALRRERPEAARTLLLRSLALQTAAGLLVVFAAAVLGGLAPAMHAQALWPFKVLLSPAAARAHPVLAGELVGAGLLLAGAAAIAVLAPRRRPLRWLAPIVALGVVWLAAPGLAPLFVPAVPTHYYRSPTGFSADSIVAGAALYAPHCAACHDAAGRDSAGLTPARLWADSDGELFWWLTAGRSGPHLAMPGFADTLSEDDRWALIDDLRARNAAAALRAWPVPAPVFSVTCAGGTSLTLADLRGGFVRVVLGAAPAVAGVTTVLAGAPANARPGPGLCLAADETAAQAYAIVAGGTARGAQFLIDGSGRLRALLPAAEAGRWNDPALLAADMRTLPAPPGTAAMPADAAM